MPDHPGSYQGRRNDYRALSEYWAKRSLYFEALNERLTEATVTHVDQSYVDRVKVFQDTEPDAYFREEWIALMLAASGYPAEVERLREELEKQRNASAYQ